MKQFTLFFGMGQIGTHEITDNRHYCVVAETVKQLRARLLKDPVLRQPFLQILTAVYEDDADFPENLKPYTPVADHTSNMSKIRLLKDRAPTDDDVIEFLTVSFPDLYLGAGDLGTDGMEVASDVKVTINYRLVNHWLNAVYNPAPLLPQLWLTFISVFLHELAHSALFWYGNGVCHSPQSGGIEREVGEYVEKAFFGGVSCGEFEGDPVRPVGMGLTKDNLFYPLSYELAIELAKLDISKGLPLLDVSTLSSAPLNKTRFRAKLSHGAAHTMTPRPQPAASTSRGLLGTRIRRPLLKDDKIRVMPKQHN